MNDKTQTANNENAGEGTADFLSNSNILVVDDEEFIRSFLYEALIDKGYNVVLADDCEQATKKLETESFDLIISDINLPGLSGNDLLKFCRKNYQNTEIILITGAPGLDNAVDAVKNGAFDYLAKPITIEKLYKRVREALEKSSQKPKNIMAKNQGIPDIGYDFVRTLGTGNMAVVFLVEKDKKQYAMKILKRDSNSTEFDLKTQRFFREAEILSGIDHPNIVKITEFGRDKESHRPYLVMEYVDGNPLNQFMSKYNFNFDQSISLIRQIASALHIVHNYGIVHRDVKPANILLTNDNIIKLTDFGIAGIEDSNLTMTREILGSPAYMSPEAFDYSAKKDHRSDIFPLGIIAYELFTGKKPFRGESIHEIMLEIKKKKPIEPLKIKPDLTPEIQDILAKMLAKSPDDRFKNASQIVDAIDRVSGKSPDKEGFTARLLRTLVLRKPTWS